MRTTKRLAALVAALPLVLPAAALADGGAPAPSSRSIPTPELTPEQRADQHYNRGIKLREKAWELEEKAAAASGSERAKLDEKAEKTYRKAVREYESAVELDPRHYRAYSDLGYALRKVGDYQEALNAYDRSLSMVPNYAEAIEYRAEAYLGLGRLDDAKEAYLQLFAGDRERADTLMKAMQQWVEKHRADPGSVDPATVEAFAEWVDQRVELADQTASLSELEERRW